MREAIGTTWTYMLVAAFTLLFTGFLVITMAFTKTYKVKNEITSIIEKYEGITTKHYRHDEDGNRYEEKTGSLEIINNYLTSVNYTTKWFCNMDDIDNYEYYGVNNLEELKLIPINSKTKERFYYCIGKGRRKNIIKVQVFFNFNVPILGTIGTFRIKGETNELLNVYFPE